MQGLQKRNFIKDALKVLPTFAKSLKTIVQNCFGKNNEFYLAFSWRIVCSI